MAFRLGIFILLISVSLGQGSEEFIVQHAPNSIQFTTGKPIEISKIADLFSSILGFTTQEAEWDGVKILNPFNRPEAILNIEIDGFKNVDANLAGKKIPLNTNVDPIWPYQLIADRIFMHFPEKNPILVELDENNLYSLKYQYPELFSTLPNAFAMADKVRGPNAFMKQGELEYLNLSVPSDLQFMKDMQTLIDVSESVLTQCKKVHDGVPDIYWMQVSGFKSVVSAHGADSTQVKEALKIIRKTLQTIQSKFVKCYGEHMLMTVATMGYEENTLVRKTRQAELPKAGTNTINRAALYPPTYSAIFQIILFTSLLFVLAVFAIALGIWFMDPGKDSIIYRMTSTRMKRD